MKKTIQFHLNGNWQGKRLDHGHLSTTTVNTDVSVPSELGGPGVGSNPEELLLASAAACYMITLAAVLERREQLKVNSFELQSEATVIQEGYRLKYTQIIHKPTITLAAIDDELRELAEQSAHRAEKACMISQALKGNVEVIVQPTIIHN